LAIYQKADQLAHGVYKIAKKLPREEMFGLSSQLKRAVLSVPTNIVEGYARHSDQAFKNFLAISYSSLVEVEYLLYFTYQENLVSQDDFKGIQPQIEELEKMLWQFISKIKKDIAQR